MVTRYYEDLSVGETHDSRGRTVTKAEIIEFASLYDPQPFHVDVEASQDTMFGSLIASGFQTLAICHRLASSAYFLDMEVVSGLGLTDLWWHKPVYPDDTLSVTVTILDLREMDDRRDGGYVDVKIEGFNQDGEPVVSWTAHTIMARKPTE